VRVKINSFAIKFKPVPSLPTQGRRLACLFSLSPSLRGDKSCKVKKAGESLPFRNSVASRDKKAVWTLSCSGNAPHKLQAEFALSGYSRSYK